ncbi:Protein SPEC3 [Cyphomyrmex costatus]|uniref:Protein SPEC3 n=1 Tax=Cyphomyrmex costatus TaxID=456900 RepID=A0A195CP38_9HYME|nr:Protein SPEC3 [Cyphomyrmex costatus]
MHLHAEIENLRQRLLERDNHIVTMETQFLNEADKFPNGELASMKEELLIWQEKYARLHEAHKRVQKVNQNLEDKLLRIVDKCETEKSTFTKDIATLSHRLADANYTIHRLTQDNARFQDLFLFCVGGSNGGSRRPSHFGDLHEGYQGLVRMRRSDRDGQVARQGPPPFRVLAVPDNMYLSPPPPRAPEPYKVAPTSTSLGRAHRRSSFVILAESRPASPETGDASSTLPTGRVSPFRGRGFKGPPPRSMSRPQSPEVAVDGRRRKVERRVSLSQQNSPRRSLIPQPTYRQRSTSLTKDNERSPSPKIGRRVDSRTRLNATDSRNRLNAADSNNVNNNSTATRRQPTKGTTRLSPIQGTPTKPEKTTPRSNVREKDATKQSPTKTTRRTTSPQKSNAAARKDNQSRSPSKECLLSPSKIPLKANKANGTSSTGRFISMREQSTGKAERFAKESKSDKQASQLTSELNSKEDESNGNPTANADDVDLIDLLKQTSQATGTSSERLVNTTTTTAVQPLHIDANTLHVERNDGSTTNQQKERSDGALKSSPMSKSESPSTPNAAASTSQKSSPFVENQSVKATQAANSGNDKKDSPVGGAEGGSTTGGHSKSGSVNQSTKTVRMNDESRSSNQSSANQRSVRNSQNARGSRPSDGKATEESRTASTTEIKSASANSRTTVTRDVPTNDKMPTVMENDSKVKAAEEARTVNNATAMSNSTMTNNVAKSNSMSPAVGAVNAGVNGDTAAVRTRNVNRGSDASLKSSTDSIGSVRSTDTGVSVNTVRGVSSPREKTGVHTVKRPQEIETLSGNIVRVEQNGEPAVLTSSNEKQSESKKLLARWRRSLSQYCKCCSSMRCLACRRDPKGLLWTRKQDRTTVINAISSPVATPVLDAPPATTNALSCWSKLKARCRCARTRDQESLSLRERFRGMKCCTRKSRIAPAEPTVCCPPERRCGVLCRRAFSCCKCNCKRADAQQRTRNTRAKHSLTSVAPPPLSEEPKAKIPDVLVEHNSVMRGAIPCLPVPLAWFCLVWNFLLPGTGTVWSGLFNLCTGQPRFSAVAGARSRLGALIVNLIVGVGQMFTVLFCLVGWGWSIWWGVTMVRLARKYKRFKISEATNNDPEARGGEPAALPPGVPSQALRGMERAR